MTLGKVIGRIWATVQDPNLAGCKLMLVQPMDAATRIVSGAALLCVDVVEAGVGDTVLVVNEGGSARMMLGNDRSPVESVIVGVVDELHTDSAAA